jgi:methylated-DNA-protein-cysteine methyltransferase-like protein
VLAIQWARPDSLERIAGRRARIAERVRAIREGFVRTYGDIEPSAPRLVGLVLSHTHDVAWHRVVRADGRLPKGEPHRHLLVRDWVPMRGERVDLGQARLAPEL